MDRYIAIGKISAPQGVAGEVRVVPLTDFPQRFQGLRQVYLTGNHGEPKAMEILGVRFHKQYVLLKLDGILNRDQAERLRGWLIQIAPEEVHPLPPDHYYHFQLVGLQVETTAGEALGEVVEVLTPGSNDVLVVKNQDGQELLIPALKKVIQGIDLENGKMWVELLEGLR